jgi:hypothetical protein
MAQTNQLTVEQLTAIKTANATLSACDLPTYDDLLQVGCDGFVYAQSACEDKRYKNGVVRRNVSAMEKTLNRAGARHLVGA